MKRFLGLILVAASSAWGVTVGDTYEQVIAEKGQPVGTVNAGSVRVLNYPDLIVKVKGDVVVAFRSPDRGNTSGARLVASESQAKSASSPTAPALESGDPNAPAATWVTDFNVALDQARTRNSHLFILFTGSDWSSWCQKMDTEVYSSPTFAKYARDKLVLMKADFLRHSPQPDDLRTQNDELAKRFDVQSYPCVVIVDGSGHVVVRISGYQQGGASNFVGMLQRYE